MAFFHHGTIRKYTAAILDLFNDFEIQYENSLGEVISKPIPLRYISREKAKLFDEYTTEQLLSGNYSILPRASLALQTLAKVDSRVTNKNTKINQYKTDALIEYSFNSVPYEFTYEIVVQCRGMNEATQIIEQVAPKFNPTVNIDVWDAANLSEPTRIPVRLTDIQLESEDYEEISSNIFSVTFSLSLMGNLYPPIKSQERIKEFRIMMNQGDGSRYQAKELLEWDVDINGNILGGTITTDVAQSNPPGGTAPKPAYTILGEQIGISDAGDYFTATSVEGALQEIMGKSYQPMSEKGEPFGYAGLDNLGKVPSNQLPDFVDDVLEYPTRDEFPLVGEPSKIYIPLNTNDIYRYSVSSAEYVKLSDTTVLEAVKVLSNRTVVITPRLQIVDNAVVLPYHSLQQIKYASVYEDGSDVVTLYTCETSQDGAQILFDSADNLNGLTCTVEYLAAV